VITSAALCPSAPLLVRGLTGVDPAVPELRRACLDVVADLVAGQPDVVAVVGAADQSGSWEGRAKADLLRFAPGLRFLRGQECEPGPGSAPGSGSGSPEPAGLPIALGVGAWLLTESGYVGERMLQALAHDEPANTCADAGAALAAARDRVALLVMADGSARRTLKAPGYFDERSAPFDAEVERAVRDGDLGALLRVDAGLAKELMATGRPAWQALAGALAGQRASSEVRYCDDPFGVAYMVASFRVRD
jgi:hypothetical protein